MAVSKATLQQAPSGSILANMASDVWGHDLDSDGNIVAPSGPGLGVQPDPKMLAAPFCYLSGHKLVEFNPAERRNFERYVRNGGFVFVDDCNHDIDGLFAKSFEAQMASIFGPRALAKIPNSHPVYSSFFRFPDGPPATSFELNGWGDDLVHNYLKGISIDGRLGVLYSNKDYGCEWDYDWRNKRFLAEDNTKFAVNIVVYAMTA